ncbi:hypothetical protein PHYC_03813 [Phycisphaerales bacterium]|nr:hypothetical protein PHYC_03813 [Phycisphaerales bacterium]
MSTDQFVHALSDSEILTPLLIFAGVVIIVLIRSAASVVSTVARERTRREIAAFIAEGSMTPEQGEKLMKAGERKTC